MGDHSGQRTGRGMTYKRANRAISYAARRTSAKSAASKWRKVLRSSRERGGCDALMLVRQRDEPRLVLLPAGLIEDRAALLARPKVDEDAARTVVARDDAAVAVVAAVHGTRRTRGVRPCLRAWSEFATCAEELGAHGRS